ncbi:aminotransferase class I/II-fold pyridoxal phosphate-dependent enzyme [Hymenobacter negativus]|uniref:Aminotransferase class I/II-fold pyridoxal phosphate-dependent enzyme n=1 Tax=Hymenobacter negativus TaxID=2795026 RepID=A0ABS0Q4D1_9BACT|nr:MULTISPECIES: aminotransferase class I/II-fold pyridoxal phosphate-dependent enzyme [Bacteria]MBH8557124.1 aminotransferase class I/II-fold pyridoxal phosphate-dependent enzyme [Hymenobacter negativus]MBH8569417.1 aminotransferase class I/II-fold pyridoxal phosphate-dependent enzyme [Hymenobacter negativus]MBR7209153.1 aminotransferase class I/II-fold pyridoxal phosphate-dependent enzyme [Microvirga sp. STS02]
MDIFDRIEANRGPLGSHSHYAEGYFMFPKLEGEIGPHMGFRGRKMLNWSLNNYLGLANHPEVRKVDAEAAAEFGMAMPMGARMMSGNSANHERLERELSEFVQKPATYLLNFGYQGVVSIIDSMVGRHDVIVYDAESHACIIDGVRLHAGKRFVYRHNDMASLEKQLTAAKRITDETGGGIFVITEGVFGMSGNQGDLRGVIKLKEKFSFRLFVDDAHGFGTMGPTGAGTGEAQGVQDGIDLYFSTFAKSMASIGAFVSGPQSVIEYLRYNMRSQVFAKSLPMPLVVGAIKRLELLRTKPELRENLWTIVHAIQNGLREKGFNIGTTTSPVTPVLLEGEIPDATQVTLDLRENHGIFCSIVVYPVVPKGVIMLRIIPTAVHTLEDVQETIAAFEVVADKLKNGLYSRTTAVPQAV